MSFHSPVIAVVDDDPSMREALQGLIGSFGFATVSFDSAKALLASQAVDELACLVMDIQMPGMSGLELQSELNAVDRSPPLIFVTSFPDDNVRARALASGAIGFLPKPVDRDELIGHIKTALDLPKTS